MTKIYPARKSNALLCSCLGHFAERKPFGKSADWKSNALRGGWVNCPASPRHPLRCCSEISRAELRSGTIAHKGSNTAFSLSGCTDATSPAGGTHKPSQGLTRGSAFWGCGVQLKWAVIGRGCPEENLLSILRFSELLRTTNLVRGGRSKITAG